MKRRTLAETGVVRLTNFAFVGVFKGDCPGAPEVEMGTDGLEFVEIVAQAFVCAVDPPMSLVLPGVTKVSGNDSDSPVVGPTPGLRVVSPADLCIRTREGGHKPEDIRRLTAGVFVDVRVD